MQLDSRINAAIQEIAQKIGVTITLLDETGDVLKNDEECGRNVATNEEILWKQFAEMQETVKE